MILSLRSLVLREFDIVNGVLNRGDIILRLRKNYIDLLGEFEHANHEFTRSESARNCRTG